MKALLIALLAAVAATPALAQHSGHPMPAPMSPPAATEPQADSHAGHDMSGMQPTPPADTAGHGPAPLAALSEEPPPPAAFSGPRHAADLMYDPQAMVRAREDLRAEQGAFKTYTVLLDQFEARIHDGRDSYFWDAQGWYGGDINKPWIKSEGRGSFGEKVEEIEVQALWSRAITPWFDAQAGLRYDFRPDPERGHLVLGLQGLVPYQFEVDAAAFVSDEGDVSARLEAEYDLLITQRLILQPRVEVNLAAQAVRELGVGSGINDVELGLRLRYEFVREFAPYVGVEWERKLGETADFARDEGKSVDDLFFVAGVRAWF